MNKIILIGGGGHCKSVIDVIEQQAQYEIAGIVDKPEFINNKILGYTVIGDDSDLEKLSKKYTCQAESTTSYWHSNTPLTIFWSHVIN